MAARAVSLPNRRSDPHPVASPVREPTPYERVVRARARWRAAIEDGSLDPARRQRADREHRVQGACAHLDPVLVPRERFDADGAVAERVARSIHRAVCSLAGDPTRATSLLGAPIGRSDAPLYVRLDATPAGAIPAVMALHCGPVGGFHTQELVNASVLASRPDGLPGTGARLVAPVLDAVAGRHRMRSGRDTPPNTVLLLSAAVWTAGRGVPPAAEGFAQMVRAAGWDVRIGTPADLTRRGGRLELTTERWPVEAVFGLLPPDEPGMEIVERAADEALIVHANPPHPHAARAILEVVDDPAVPWTRVLADRTTTDPDGREGALLEAVLADRGRYVLKPSEGFGASNVVIGRETSQERWRCAVDSAIGAPACGTRWVVQEHRSLPTQTFHPLADPQRLVRRAHDLNLFLVDGSFVGYTARWFAPATQHRPLRSGVAPVLVI